MREVLRRYAFVLVPGTAVLLLTFAYLLNPHLVYDRFVWRFYWGPVVADAAGLPYVTSTGGVTAYAGYNWVNTLTWAGLLGVSLLGILRLLDNRGIVLSRRFVAAVVPFVLFGAAARAMEDAGALGPPLQYLFITPIIYILVFVLVFAALLSGEWIEGKNSVGKDLFVATCGSASLASVLVLLAGGLAAPGTRPLIPLEAAGLGTALAAPIYAVGRRLELGFLTERIGVGIVAAHMFDASSTFIGYTLGYTEKHVLPTLLIGLTGTPAVMFPLKLAVILPVLYVLYEWGESGTFETLLYLTVLVLGLAPGTRNVLRMALGV